MHVHVLVVPVQGELSGGGGGRKAENKTGPLVEGGICRVAVLSLVIPPSSALIFSSD